MSGLLIAGCIGLFAFNLWALNRGWLHEFGHVTRGEYFFHVFLAAFLPAGFLLALMSLATQKWPNAWSRFWNKDMLP